MAATVELSTPPLMATTTVLAVATVGVAFPSSNWVRDDNCWVLFACEVNETDSKPKANSKTTAKAGGLKTAATLRSRTAGPQDESHCSAIHESNCEEPARRRR